MEREIDLGTRKYEFMIFSAKCCIALLPIPFLFILYPYTTFWHWLSSMDFGVYIMLIVVPFAIFFFAMDGTRLYLNQNSLCIKSTFWDKNRNTILIKNIRRIQVLDYRLEINRILIANGFWRHHYLLIHENKIDNFVNEMAKFQIAVEVDNDPLAKASWAAKDDIGYFAATVVILSMPMVAVGLYLDYCTSMTHFFWTLGWHGLAVSIPLCIVIGYYFIRLEKKAHPFISAIVAGSILGIAVNYAAIKAIQLWSESQQITDQTVEMSFFKPIDDLIR